MFINLEESLPIKEGFSALRLKPFGIIEMEVMPITMSRVNLFHIKNEKQNSVRHRNTKNRETK